NIVVVQDTENPPTPDAIFPHNWFSTQNNNSIILYPMMAQNRRKERQNPVLSELEKQFKIEKIIDLTSNEEQECFLEGTGSIIFDHEFKMAYAAISKRTNKDLFHNFCRDQGFSPLGFEAFDA